MNKLIGANLVRLMKDKILWICLAIMVAMAGFILYTCYHNSIVMGTEPHIDGGFFLEMQFVGVMIAAFCSMFVGTEYNDGIIRNKIVIGNKRSSIYLSNFITVSIAGELIQLAYLLSFSGIGMVAFAGMWTMLSMCIQNRTIVMAITIIGAFLLLFVAIFLYSSLSEPPVWDSYLVQDNAGNIITMPEEVNTQYISGVKREVYTFLFDFIPAGQGIQLAQGMSSMNWWLPVYSFIIAAVTTVTGLVIFQKKDTK